LIQVPSYRLCNTDPHDNRGCWYLASVQNKETY